MEWLLAYGYRLTAGQVYTSTSKWLLMLELRYRRVCELAS